MKTSFHVLASLLLLTLSPAARAVSIYALTTTNKLLIVDADVPQDILSIQTITGLDTGDRIVAIDVRPANGQLYGLGKDARIYTINGTTGAATKVADLAADPADTIAPFYTGLSGTNFGMDFNPVTDRLRVVSNADQNLRINPGNGLVSADTPLAYAFGDAHQGANPNVGDIAYSNNVAGATTTILYGIDDTAFTIVAQNLPNSGMLHSIAPFGVTYATHVGFDIAPDGTGYVAGRHAVPNTPVEYILATLDPATGNGESHGPIGDGTIPILDIAVAPTVSFSQPRYAISEDGGSALITVKREGFLNTTVSVHYSTFSDTASAGSDYITVAGTLTFGPGEKTKSFRVPIVNDSFPEEDETVGLLLTNVTGRAVLGFPSVATLRINANDRPDTTGPQIVSIGLTGPSRGINGAIIYFNEDMDPVTVENLANYKLAVYPVGEWHQIKTFSSAVYDPVDRKVTLTLAPFMQTAFASMALRVTGTGSGLTDLAGNLLDGDRNGVRGGDAVQAFDVFSGTTVVFTDRDGDRVTLQLTGGGQLDGVVPVGGPSTQQTQFWILDPIALKTTLQGSVTRSATGNGIVVIAEIIGLDKKEFFPISTNPVFQINRLTFSPNATGLGLR